MLPYTLLITLHTIAYLSASLRGNLKHHIPYSALHFPPQILPDDLLSSSLAPRFMRLATLLTVSHGSFSTPYPVYSAYVQADDLGGSKRRPSA